jgi:hypothetical protein
MAARRVGLPGHGVATPPARQEGCVPTAALQHHNNSGQQSPHVRPRGQPAGQRRRHRAWLAAIKGCRFTRTTRRKCAIVQDASRKLGCDCAVPHTHTHTHTHTQRAIACAHASTVHSITTRAHALCGACQPNTQPLHLIAHAHVYERAPTVAPSWCCKPTTQLQCREPGETHRADELATTHTHTHTHTHTQTHTHTHTSKPRPIAGIECDTVPHTCTHTNTNRRRH